jgi:hypothetical protein
MPLATERLRRAFDGLPTTARAAPAEAPAGVFRRDGDLWLLAFAGREVRVADAKGLHDLHLLLRCAGQSRPGDRTGRAAVADGPVDVLLDDRARRAYRSRLADLDEALQEAEDAGDDERAGRALRSGRPWWTPWPRPPASGGAAGRAPTTSNAPARPVRRRIRHVLRAWSRCTPSWPGHLAAAVQTGRRCGYLPESPVTWQT